MVLRSKLDLLAMHLKPLFIMCIGCAYSLLIATNIRCHGSLAIFLTEETGISASAVPPAAVHWLGATPGMVAYLFVPLFTGVVDHFKLSYRICSLVASGAILVGSILSSGFLDLGQLIITDAVVTGCGASLMLSVIVLVIDDNFPADSGLRILATTLVQGVAYATFFFVDAHSVMLNAWGWKAAFYVYGGAAAGLGLLAALLFDREPRPLRRSQPPSPPEEEAGVGRTAVQTGKDGGGDGSGGGSGGGGGGGGGGGRGGSVIDAIHDKVEWKSRLLSLSQVEMDSSRTILLWMLERQLAAVISDGAFLFLLTRSGITRHPIVLGSTPSPRLSSILPAFVYSVGSTTSYLGGAVLGCLIQGRLLTAYMTCALVNACALIGWAAVAGSRGYNAELAFAWACGFGVGGINTFAYAASEEATGIPARSVFPYTKLTNGLSIAIIQVVYGALGVSETNPLDLLLVLLLLLSVGQFAVLVFIRQLRRSPNASRQTRCPM